MAEAIFIIVAVAVFLQMCWESFKRDLGIKTYYSWDELEAMELAKRQKWEARKLTLKNFFNKFKFN